MIYIIIALALLLLYFLYKTYIENKETNENELKEENIPYCKKFLLTKNEYYFYKCLKEIADKNDLCVLAKVRLADLVEVNSEAKGKERLKYFSKIKSKHIDFVLCDKSNLYPKLLIELLDSSHNESSRQSRDEFIKKVAEKTNYKIIFVYNANELESKITAELSEK